MESIPEPALEEIEGVGTHRSLPYVELLLFSPRGHAHQHGSLHDAWNKFNSDAWHPLTLKGHYSHKRSLCPWKAFKQQVGFLADVALTCHQQHRRRATEVSRPERCQSREGGRMPETVGSETWKAVLGLRSHHSEQLLRHSKTETGTLATACHHHLGITSCCHSSCIFIPCTPQIEQTHPEPHLRHRMLQ